MNEKVSVSYILFLLLDIPGSHILSEFHLIIIVRQFFKPLTENILCDHPSVLLQRKSSDEGDHNMLSADLTNIIPQYHQIIHLIQRSFLKSFNLNGVCH